MPMKGKMIAAYFIEIFTFFAYAEEESDGLIGDSSKTVQYSIKNISRNIKAVFFKLAPEITITKERNDTHRVIAMTTAMPLVLF